MTPTVNVASKTKFLKIKPLSFVMMLKRMSHTVFTILEMTLIARNRIDSWAFQDQLIVLMCPLANHNLHNFLVLYPSHFCSCH